MQKQIELNLEYHEFIKMNYKDLDLIFMPFNIHRIYRGLSTEQLNIILNLFSNNKYFKNSTESNYNEIVTNLGLTINASKYINIINIQMLYDFYDFLKTNNNKNMHHLECLYLYFCKVEKVGGDFVSLMINKYINAIDFNYVIFKIVNNYHKYTKEEILDEYNYRKSLGTGYNNLFMNDIEYLVENLNNLKSTHILIKLSIFKVSTENILITDVFNVIMNISLKIN